MSTLGLVMRQTNANMQMSLRRAEISLNEEKRYKYTGETPEWMKKMRLKRLDALKQTEVEPKSEYQIRYETRIKQEYEEKRIREVEMRTKKVNDSVYGHLFNLDIQKEKDIKALAEEIAEYLNWFYTSYEAYMDSSLKVEVDDIDYGGKGRKFEKVSLEVIHTKKWDESFKIVVELQKVNAPAYQINVGWNSREKRHYWFDEGKMKGKFVEHVIEWAIDLIDELAKLEIEGKVTIPKNKFRWN